MNPDDTIFGGRSFNNPKDFEREFRPTKWSIRKYVRFVLKMGIEERSIFSSYTVKLLSISYSDKDTRNFIRQIKEKSSRDFGLSPLWKFDRVGSVSVRKEFTNEFITAMASLMKRGIIQCSGVQLAEIIKEVFHSEYSLSTIKDKIYKYESDNE